VVETVKLELEVSASAVTVVGATATLKSLVPGFVGEEAAPLPQPMKVDNQSATQTTDKEAEITLGRRVALRFTDYIHPFPSQAAVRAFSHESGR
jgi:hypothetical protein